jgi:hypothetical protein
MEKAGLILVFLCFMMMGCDPHPPRISVYNNAATSIDVRGDYFGRNRLSPEDSTWVEEAKLKPGDTIAFFPWDYTYDYDSLKITIQYYVGGLVRKNQDYHYNDSPDTHNDEVLVKKDTMMLFFGKEFMDTLGSDYFINAR